MRNRSEFQANPSLVVSRLAVNHLAVSHRAVSRLTVGRLAFSHLAVHPTISQPPAISHRKSIKV